MSAGDQLPHCCKCNGNHYGVCVQATLKLKLWNENQAEALWGKPVGWETCECPWHQEQRNKNIDRIEEKTDNPSK